MKVYLVYADDIGQKRYVLDPAFYDGDVGMFFTPTASSIGFLESSSSEREHAAVLKRASDTLDRYNIKWSRMDRNYRHSVRSWKGKLVDVLLVDFCLLGPMPRVIGEACVGERVDKPSGSMIRYGG